MYRRRLARQRASRKRIKSFFVVVIVIGTTLAIIKGVSLIPDGLVHAKKSDKRTLGSVCLDPGHGGSDTGANNQDLYERDLNLRVAERVESILENDGYKVYMTRTTNDPYLTNNDRVTFCNGKNTDILVAIHQNYFTDSATDYTTALYYNQNSRGLAASLANAEAARLGTTNNGIASFDDGELMRAKMPAALVEGFFISSDREYSLISAAGSTRLADEASGIVQGVENYFKNPNQKPTQDTVLDQADSPE